MEIIRIKKENIEYIDEIDRMFKLFMKEESIYDNNEKVLEKYGSFAKDIEKDNVVIFAACEENSVKGFVYGYIKDSKRMVNKIMHIGYIYVENNSRKRGIATKLLERISCYANEKNIHIIEVNVFNDNLEANLLYEKLGFGGFYTSLRKNI